ncbi:hypothetical protein V9T40_002659 [Parthenolecanium corni]|uniref:Conserved oligomeric Golgi complex subunit 8 n=1 Tax=Parthenolecanium corni TaxID=536013 RepID=A0AAN9Y3Z0_9HEMI
MDCDLETDKLMKVLFEEGTYEKYEDNPEFLGYINKLGSMTIEQLHKEKKLLDDEMASIDGQMRQLASNHYKTFIHTADTSRTIHKDICSIENDLAMFLQETPKLQTACQKFIETSAEIRERRRRNNLILSNNAEILQILEIPQFLNACIRSELYEEALLIPAFVKRLASKHGDIKLINSISEDVEKSWWELMRHLLKHLTTDISLPKCLLIVGYLRRMNVFSEVELRLKFLQARGSWLDSLLSAIPTENKSNHLNSTIDVTRVNIFSIATQYKAVFTDDEVITRQNDLKNSIFHSWLNYRINEFLIVVKDDLPKCPSNSLDSLLGQCMYFGQSFGRIGADFRGLVVNFFVETVENNFDMTMRKVDEHFSLNMRKFILPKINSVSNMNLMADSNSEKQFLTPPMSLLEYYPLTVYCNSILTAFNDLRYCTLIGCVGRVTSILQTSLLSVSKALSVYFEKENITWLEKEKETFLRMCSCFSDNLIPFLQRCLFAIFEPETMAKCLNVSASYFVDEVS